MAHRPDPTRRNRNIGTAKQGYGQNNRDRIPRSWLDSVLRWDRGHTKVIVRRHVWGRELPFLVERTREDCVHACTIDDLAAVLNMLPKRHVNRYRDIEGIQGIVLRQPTRKEQTLSPVWARMGYGVDVAGVIGPVVFIEAQRIPLVAMRSSRQGPTDIRELHRLEKAASEVTRSRRGHRMVFDLDGVRRVQLYHSLPHEIGHWADFYEHVEIPSLDDIDRWAKLWDRYFERPTVEREEFAHRYAEEAVGALRASGALPFERIFDAQAMASEGLSVDDFQLPV